MRVMTSCPSQRRRTKKADRCKVGNFYSVVCPECSHSPIFPCRRNPGFHNSIISESSYLTHSIYLGIHKDFPL